MLCLFLSVSGSTQQIPYQVLSDQEDSVSIERVERSASIYLFAGLKDQDFLSPSKSSRIRTIPIESNLPTVRNLFENRPAIEVTFENVEIVPLGWQSENMKHSHWNIECLIESNTGQFLKAVMNPINLPTTLFPDEWINKQRDVFNISTDSIILPEKASSGLLSALKSSSARGLLSAVEIEAYYLHSFSIDSLPVWILIAKWLDSSYSYSYREDTFEIYRKVFERRPTIIYQVVYHDIDGRNRRVIVTPSESDFVKRRKFPSMKKVQKK